MPQFRANLRLRAQSTNGPVAPQAWNQYEPSSKGYACDWTDAKKGERYKL